MREFLNQVKSILNAMGIQNVQVDGYDLTIAGCEFWCQQKGKSVKIQLASGEYKTFRNPATAVQGILGAMPRKMVEKKNHEKWQKTYQETMKINQKLRGTNCEVGLDSTTNGETNEKTYFYTGTFKHHDIDTIMGMIVYLQDNFLNEMQGPQLCDNDFLMRQSRFLFKGMDLDQRRELRNYLTQQIEEELAKQNQEEMVDNCTLCGERIEAKMTGNLCQSCSGI